MPPYPPPYPPPSPPPYPSPPSSPPPYPPIPPLPPFPPIPPTSIVSIAPNERVLAITFQGVSYNILSSSATYQDWNKTISQALCNYVLSPSTGLNYGNCSASVDRFFPGSIVGNFVVKLPTYVSAIQAESVTSSLLVLINIYIPSSFTSQYGISSVSGVDVTSSTPGSIDLTPSPSANPAGFSISVTLVVAIGGGIGAAVLIALVIAAIVVCCQRKHAQKVKPGGEPKDAAYHPWRHQGQPVVYQPVPVQGRGTQVVPYNGY